VFYARFRIVDYARTGIPALAFLFIFPRIWKVTKWRCFNISNKQEQQINEEIRDKEIRVVSDDGEQLGIMSAAEALKIAESRNLDLVKIAPMAKPPVCKIMDYGKFRFEKAKREGSKEKPEDHRNQRNQAFS